MYSENQAKCATQVNQIRGVREIDTAPRQHGQVAIEVEASHSLIEGLYSAILQLQGRIESTLRPEEQCGENQSKESCSIYCGLAESLREQNRKIGYATKEIEDLIGRCEL